MDQQATVMEQFLDGMADSITNTLAQLEKDTSEEGVAAYLKGKNDDKLRYEGGRNFLSNIRAGGYTIVRQADLDALLNEVNSLKGFMPQP